MCIHRADATKNSRDFLQRLLLQHAACANRNARDSQRLHGGGSMMIGHPLGGFFAEPCCLRVAVLTRETLCQRASRGVLLQVRSSAWSGMLLVGQGIAALSSV